MSNGKGDRPRPKSVDSEEYRQRWERAFRRDRKDKRSLSLTEKPGKKEAKPNER